MKVVLSAVGCYQNSMTFLMTLNSSVNFFIYCFMCATFRKLLFRLAKGALVKLARCITCGMADINVSEEEVEELPGSEEHGSNPPVAPGTPRNNNMLVSETHFGGQEPSSEAEDANEGSRLKVGSDPVTISTSVCGDASSEAESKKENV